MHFVNFSVKPLNFAPIWSISYFQPIFAAIFVTIATLKSQITLGHLFYIIKIYISFFKVFDGNNTKDATLGTYCGYVQPPVIISSANTMHIQFVSDESINDAGFRALYITFCQIPLTEPSGSFEPLDENQNGLYDKGQNCTWIITVEEGKSIQLNITDIDIDENMKTIECVSDYITVCIRFVPINRAIPIYCAMLY